MAVIFIRNMRKAAQDDPILRTADAMMPELRQAFLDAVEAAKGTIRMDALVAAVRTGDADQVIAVLALDKAFANAMKGIGLQAGITSVRSAIAATYAAAGKTAATEAAINMSLNLSFPTAVSAIDRYTFDLIQQTTATVKETVQQILRDAFIDGSHPYEQAKEIKAAIGLTSRQEAAVLRYRAELENNQLAAALERALRDGRFDRTVLAAIRNGKGLNPAKIDSMVERYRANYLKYRAEVIARTETIRASNSGQRELWKQAREKGLLPTDVKRRWNASNDARTCQECIDLDGTEAGLDEEFAPGIMDPPDPHPNCRCGVSLVNLTKKYAA